MRNEYVYVSVGTAGSFTSPSYNVPGRICVGNTGGSPRTALDDNTNLCGINTIARVGMKPSSFASDWPMYLQARIDNDNAQRFNVGFDTNSTIQAPDFQPLENGFVLISQYSLGTTGVQIRQVIRLRRSQVRFEWTVINTDDQPHNVELRWNILYRSAGNFYYADPVRGESSRTAVFRATEVPSEFTLYGRRAEAVGASTPPYAARQLLKIGDATPPSRMYVLDSADLDPGDTQVAGLFDPVANGNPLSFFRTGIATATYFPVSVAPGTASAPVVTYFGNGSANDSIAPDFVTSVDGPESLIYDTSAALDTNVIANSKNPSLSSIGARFLTSDTADPTNPQRFRIFASVYNQKLPDPLFSVSLSGVTASLTLPPGLRFAIDPATSQRDVAAKSLGTILSDAEGLVSWWVEPTGERYGQLTYQVSVSVSEPQPLSRSVSRQINIPAVPVFKYTPRVFHMTGFPFQFDPLLSDNGDPNTVLNTNVADQQVPLTLFEYIGNINPNKPYQPAKQIVPGRGYFFKPTIPQSGDRIIFLKGAKPVALQAPVGGTVAQPQRVQLQPGWNLISNPYVYDIPLSYLRFIRIEDNPDLSSATYQAALASGLIRGGVFYYSPTENSYQFFENTSEPLRPWQGYWIYVNQPLLLVYANPTLRGALVQPTPVTPTQPDPEPATRKVSGDSEWQQQLVVQRADGGRDSATFIGVRPGADSRKDMPKPPPIADYVYASLVKEGGASSRYATQFQSPGGKRTWELEIISDKDGSATLLWPEASKLPRRVTLVIKDLQTGRSQSLKSTSSLPITLRQGVASRYQITAQMASSLPLRISDLRTERSTRGPEQTITVRVTRDATLTARVLTTSGRLVQVLASGRSAAGGAETRLPWNGRDQKGAALPAGSYIVEVTARSTDGDEGEVRMNRLISVLR